MSVLGKIFGGIFKKKEAQPAPAPVVTAPPASDATVGTAAPAPSTPVAGTPAHAQEGASISGVDVGNILDFMNEQREQKLNWRTSIVDLMKLVGLESSLAERKELADELGYTGDKSDSASMNIWLHKQVIQKIRDNGGQLPTDL